MLEGPELLAAVRQLSQLSPDQGTSPALDALERLVRAVEPQYLEAVKLDIETIRNALTPSFG
jgi:CTP:molybdopterin cytidylyltransferase MocA